MSFILTSDDKESILHIAEESVQSMILHGVINPLTEQFSEGRLNEKGGAFVSLYVKGELRGCIGSFEGDTSLAEAVTRSASSACNDDRFDRLVPDELDDLEIEISVLSPLKRIRSKDEIILGKHGIFIRKGLNRGTFLPQVAEKYQWSLEEFLGRCSRDKAGLGWDGWKQAELYIYEAIVFSNNKSLI